MKQQVSFLIIATVLLASCQREQDWNSAPDIKAKVETESKTRTSLSVDESGAGTIYWNPADKIDVFFGTTKASYTSQNAADAITALFKTTDSFSGSGFSSTNIWGLYPSNSTSSCDGSAITTTLPSTQYGVPNTFDNDLFMAVAHSTSTSLHFYNVCGGIKFNLAFDDIKKVTLRGNNNEDLAGTVSISFVEGLPKATVVKGVKEITLTPKTGATFMKGEDYYFTLLPGTLSEGFTMEFTTLDGSVAFLNYDESPVTIKRSVFSKKGNLDVYASFGDQRQPNNVIYYTSTDGQIVTPYKTDVFGANIVSNEYVGRRGIITFDGDVTSIGSYSFFGCSGLTSIEIPNSVTTICDNAFSGCRGLTNLLIPNSVKRIDGGAFSDCSGLTSIVVDSDNTHYDSRNNCNAIINSTTNQLITGCANTVIPNSVTSIYYAAFYGCSGLTTIEIPNSVMSIGDHAFYFCGGLTSIKIPNSVSSIGDEAFYHCIGLSSIEIPNSVTSIGYGVFFGCSGLTSIVVASDNTLYDSRNNCNALINSITNELITGSLNTIIPNSITSIGEYAFSGCSGLTTIEIPGSVTSIGNAAFIWCSGLTSIEIPDSVTSIGDHAFSGCCGLTSIVVYSAIPPSGESSMFHDTHNCPIYVPAESVDAYKTALYWSDYADRIQAIPQPNSVIYYTSSDGKVVTPKKTDFNGVNLISNEYLGDKGILTFDGDIFGIEESSFAGCTSLTSIALPSSVYFIEVGAFSGCTGLDFVIPNTMESIGQGAFHYCSSLTSIVLPKSVTSFGYGNPFGGCSGVTSIVVDSDNPVFDSREECNAIIHTQRNELVSGCRNTVIPNTVQSIGISAFLNCTGLTSIEIPASITQIGGSAFSKCTDLVSFIIYAETPPEIGIKVFQDTDNCTIYVPASSVDTYKSAWSTYANRIHSMGDLYEAVDLGLSVKWATCNLGATEPEGYGDYYAWGETDPYYSSQDPLTWKEGKTGYDWASYQWCNGSSNTLTRYCPDDQLSFWGGPGTPDGKTEFKDYNYADDAARHILGGKWRTPTDAEWTELRSNCTWTWTTQNGVTGYRVTSNKTGYTDKSIFLPAAGGRDGAFLYDVGSYGLYWSSSLDTDVPYYAWYVLFNSGTVFREHFDRYCGQSVRPVSE